MSFLMTFIKQVTMMVSLFLLLVSPTPRYLIMACLTSARFWDAFFYVLPPYLLIVGYFRHRRVNKIKEIYGFSDNFESYRDMTPDVAQVVLKNLAEFDFPFTFEFGWISEFFKVRTDFWAYGSFPPHFASISIRLSPSFVQAYLEFSEVVAYILFPLSHSILLPLGFPFLFKNGNYRVCS